MEDVPRPSHVRLNLTIPPELDSYLDEIGAKARATGGYKLPKTAVLRALVLAFQALQVDVTGGVRSEADLLNRILSAAESFTRKDPVAR